MAFKEFYNPNTGKIVSYPEHFALTKRYLITLEDAPEVDPCVDCHVSIQDELSDTLEDVNIDEGTDE